MITGIVVALPEELAALTSKRIEKGHCVFISDKLLAAYSGAGAENAQAAAELLIAKGANQLLSWGCAAALSPALKSGDLVLPDKLVDTDDNEIAVDADWLHYSKNALAAFVPVHDGSLAESKNIVSSSREKDQIHIITGAAALDMESAAVAKVAQQKSLPFLAIRVIVDPAGMDLPKAIEYSLSPQGEVKLLRLLLFIALHPIELPRLIRLGLQFNAAKNTLKRVAQQLNTLIDFRHLNL